jgi:AraC family transcriptional regulator of adaptative response / DNA-3-methyladenine glycosylase II
MDGVRLPFRSPFAAEPLLGFLGARAIPGVEDRSGPTFRRSVPTAAGPAVVELTPLASGGHVRLDATGGGAASLPALERVGRSLLDLDADPHAIGRVLGRDPLLRPLVRAHRGVRVPGTADGFELVVRAILGQQVSVRAARTMLGRVAEAFGTPLAQAVHGVTTLFPSAARLADAPLERLGVTGRRAATIRSVASLVASGELDLSGGGDAERTAARLLALDGIGPWTVEYVRLRALGDPDAFPATDLGIRRSLAALGIDPASAASRSEAWRPWRAYAAMLLWQHT